MLGIQNDMDILKKDIPEIKYAKSWVIPFLLHFWLFLDLYKH